MKRFSTVAFLFLLFHSASIAQEFPELKNFFGAKVLFIDYGRPNNLDNLNLTNGIELTYLRSLSRNINVAIPLKVGVANVPDEMNNLTFGSLDALVQIKTGGKKIDPYIFGGAGYFASDTDNSTVQFPLGGGLNIKAGSNTFLNIQGEYRVSSQDKRNNMQAGLGILFRLGRNPDADRDGVSDKEDACPDMPGPVATRGCPDKDMDGIADKLDACPELAGQASAQGCPDADGDGFSDDKDDCPQEAGLINGCPDTDGDGVLDKNDKCPEEAGPETNNGCPIIDTDGDGIPDDNDRCPTEPGLAVMTGCPDTDGDGIPDIDDRCVDNPGLQQWQGCPDADGDGVPDPDDRCPDVVGPVTNKGCPEVREEAKKTLTTAMRTVKFQPAKDVLVKTSFPILDEVVKVMEEYPAYHLIVKGHTDNIGKADENQVLSERRAKACYDYLIGKGVDSSRLSHKGFGQTQPIGDNKTYSGRSKNRRVEFELYLP